MLTNHLSISPPYSINAAPLLDITGSRGFLPNQVYHGIQIQCQPTMLESKFSTLLQSTNFLFCHPILAAASSCPQYHGQSLVPHPSISPTPMGLPSCPLPTASSPASISNYKYLVSSKFLLYLWCSHEEAFTQTKTFKMDPGAICDFPRRRNELMNELMNQKRSTS
jgi:hypothetical protein